MFDARPRERGTRRRRGAALALALALLTFVPVRAQTELRLPALETPVETVQVLPDPAEPSLSGRVLRGLRGGAVVWSVTFPVEAGALLPPVVDGDTVWVAVGPTLQRLSLRDGVLRSRLFLPAEVVSLERSDEDLLVTVRHMGRVQENFTVRAGEIVERVVYPPAPKVTGALEAGASAGLSFDPLRPEDPLVARRVLEARVGQDPENPFLQLYYARALHLSGERAAANEALQRAVNAHVPFFVHIRLAVLLDTLGESLMADQALLQARLSWAALGYDPALPVSRFALNAYGNPLGYTELLQRQNHALRADAWLRFLRDIAPRFEGYEAAYRNYADWLDGQGRSGEAIDWRNFSRELAAGSLYDLGPGALLIFRDAARFAVFALLASLGFALLALYARYWSQQSHDLRPLGGRLRSWRRNPVLRLRHAPLSYFTFSEKLVVLTLLGALLMGLAAWAWSQRTFERAQHPVLNFGTYGGAWFYDGIGRLNLDANAPETAFLLGTAAQLDGDADRATELYRSAPNVAGARNNLGVLASARNDEVAARNAYREALSLDPRLVAAAYNLQLDPSGFEINFQRQYRSGLRLAYPQLKQVYRAFDGQLSGDLSRMVTEPWTYLMSVPSGLPPYLQAVWVALLLLAFTVTVLWLLVPRPGRARPTRPLSYRLLSLLVPGSGLLDEVWGLLLLVPWAGVLLVLLSLRPEITLAFPQLYDRAHPGLPGFLTALLIGIYLLNTVAVLLEEIAVWRRERRLADRSPSS
ncbi:tetratricopeptide (TPR) repeat protein [Deinobacterium chartae]|uniref:Tetratricopeptide (TPR) repeat protein n=1 Tax=Deinobacterium chartae TaxID=521158 RepID=A0A841I0E0_9DEIO|nr:hypothetical protein [Deinobacterium chartae]MBB6098576.1 tetratricopeptide (TPR) repeat protein [Deinobacterium chartae]